VAPTIQKSETFKLSDPLVIDRAYRPTIKATKHDDGSVIVHAGRSWMQFDADDLQQLYAFAADRPTIQRFPMAPECPLTATEGDETAAAG
jgi:hypothetical protein